MLALLFAAFQSRCLSMSCLCCRWGRSECQTGRCNCNYNPLGFLPFDLEPYTCMDWGCGNAQ